MRPHRHDRPLLLVSVRNAAEAVSAIDADIVDVKEPANGALGRADARVVRAVVERVGRRRPVTAAAGELGELTPHRFAAWCSESGAGLVKLGIESPANEDLAAHFAAYRRAAPLGVTLAPVVYADRLTPEEARDACSALCGPGEVLVVDTQDKSAPGLTGCWPDDQIARVLAEAERLGVRVALAGRLTPDCVRRLAPLGPAVIGVRGAACEHGRSGVISAARVAILSQALAAAAAVVV